VNLAVGLGPGVMGVDDHRHALIPCLAGQVVQGDQGVGRQIVEKGRHFPVEQGQPVLHPRPATAPGDGFIERVAARRAKRLHIAPAEPGNGLHIQKGLADRQQGHILQLPGGALGFRIKSPDRLQGCRQTGPDEPVPRRSAGRHQLRRRGWRTRHAPRPSTPADSR